METTPPRLSTITCWPSASPSRGAINRAVKSRLPPGTVVRILPDDDQFLPTVAHLFVPVRFDLSDQLRVFQRPVVLRRFGPPLSRRIGADDLTGLRPIACQRVPAGQPEVAL